MLICTQWKARPLTPDQANRMMQTWGKVEAAQAENPNVDRVCWFIFTDGSGGFTVNKASDADAGAAFELETALALGEFLEFDSNVVLDLDSAMPAILKGMELINT
jgi:hypothetical protein